MSHGYTISYDLGYGDGSSQSFATRIEAIAWIKDLTERRTCSLDDIQVRYENGDIDIYAFMNPDAYNWREATFLRVAIDDLPVLVNSIKNALAKMELDGSSSGGGASDGADRQAEKTALERHLQILSDQLLWHQFQQKRLNEEAAKASSSMSNG